MKNLLSKLATSNGHGEESAYFDGWKAYDNDPFHPSTNPQGVIQMGLAENQLCFEKMEKWIMDHPSASICTSQGVDGFKDVAIFQDYHGLPRFRMAAAKFMGRARGNRVSFDPDRIVMGGGATGASETIMFCLANPGDAFLLPTPYYPAFDRDLRWRTGIKLIPVHTDSSTDFTVTRTSLESAYNKARESNINVKGLILTNPSNPLGTTIHKHTLKDLVAFTNSNDLHLVCDEIYAGTVFAAPEFTSVADIIHEDPDSVNPELIHIISSLSKDLGLPGFRVGLIYSYNDAVLSCARKMSSFGLVSSQTQHLLAAMLSDEAFVGSIMAESPIRLEKRRRVFVEGLAEMGIGSLRGNAGLFFWMDLRPLLKSPTVEAETELWRVILDEVKLNVSPGSSFHCSEPGWFRVCFANMGEDTVEVALQRIRAFVSSKERVAVAAEKEEIEKKKNNSKVWRQKNNLRLSFSSRNRLYEESLGFMSSAANVMSPHSPIPHSPLVPAMT